MNLKYEQPLVRIKVEASASLFYSSHFYFYLPLSHDKALREYQQIRNSSQ